MTPFLTLAHCSLCAGALFPSALVTLANRYRCITAIASLEGTKGGERALLRSRAGPCRAGPGLSSCAPARVKTPLPALTSELLFNHQGILMACQSNEIWLEATWSKHYDKSLSHKPTQGLMAINHHFGGRKMTAIKIMNGMINFSH